MSVCVCIKKTRTVLLRVEKALMRLGKGTAADICQFKGTAAS